MKIMSTELRVQRAEREARLWHRIANRLHDAFTNPDCTEQDRADAVEEYLNYHNPTDDE